MREFRFVVAANRGPSTEVRIEAAEDAALARAKAQMILRESTNHVTVEVWEGETHLFSVARTGVRGF